MRKQLTTVCAGYGAYELKTTYQRNMLLGTLFTVLLTALVISGAYIYQALTQDLITIDGRPPIEIEIIIDRIPPPTIIPPDHSPNLAEEIEQIKDKLGTPVPVHDDDVINDDFMIASIEERRELNEYRFEKFDFDTLDSIVIDLPPEKERPGINDYVYVDQRPEMIYYEMPDYPRLAKQAGMEGVVTIKVLVDRDGNVEDAVVYISSESNAGFDRAALSAAFECRFKPAIQGNYPIPVWVTYQVVFELTD